MAGGGEGARRRERLRVRGIVQGVGFRPFVYRVACREGLTGFVRNDGAGVTIEAEGPPAALDRLAAALLAEAPPLALVREVAREPLGRSGDSEDGFRIVASEGGAGRDTLISPDVATCDDCLRELRDPTDRRHGYPFLNCTSCGPRFTIVADLPYDRPNTTMRGFALCPACRAEYEDPADRRFHAQPTACPACGPQVRLLAPGGAPVAAADPVAAAAERLRRGEIVALKGLGGYHLACDATSEPAVERLRRRKLRDEKPFAVMVRDLAAARAIASVADGEAALLARRERPIVLLRKRRPCPLADGVAPRNGRVGLLLPYTPLHHLLLDAFGGPLVMTSGNRSDEPIVHDDATALRVLAAPEGGAAIADLVLTHDRPILVRADDSVMRVVGGVPRHLRRSRGFVPTPVFLPRGGPSVLAVGAELKGAICLTRGDQAFPGQHLGDLEHLETVEFFEESVAHLARILDVRPALVVHDAHPEYRTTRWAQQRSGLPTLAVQHHHAHVLSCLAENGHAGPAVGLALDGTGWGADGTIWGGEVLVVDGLTMRRAAHAKPLPLPGGDRAAEEPWRMALSALVDAFGAGEQRRGLADLPPLAGVPAERAAAVWALLTGPLGPRQPRSSGVGRLFDAVAALTGLRLVARYEGQAPMELESAAEDCDGPALPYPTESRKEGDRTVLDFAPAIRAVVADVRARRGVAPIAARFHETVVAAFAAAAIATARAAGLDTVALTGGVFQNERVLSGLTARLAAARLRALTHAQVPANDGGISLGQAWAGVLKLT